MRKPRKKLEASKARYEADLKRFKAAEIAKTEAENLEIFEQSEPKKGEAIFFYDEHPMIRTYASEEEKILRAMVEKVQAEPKLYVKLATVDSQKEKTDRRDSGI